MVVAVLTVRVVPTSCCSDKSRRRGRGGGRAPISTSSVRSCGRKVAGDIGIGASPTSSVDPPHHSPQRAAWPSIICSRSAVSSSKVLLLLL